MRFTSFTINRPVKQIHLDRLELDPSGVIRVAGWSRADLHTHAEPRVFLDGETVPFLQRYRVSRPDVDSSVGEIEVLQAGIVFEYRVPESMLAKRFESVSLAIGNLELYFAGSFDFVKPHYGELLDSERVYHRDDIYGSGPPNRVVHPDILALAKKLESPVLDFGCGSGFVVAELRAIGVEAQGLELDTQMIRGSMLPAAKPYISLYNGALPSPFSPASFRSVFCSEVIEHIPDFEAAVREVARLSIKTAIFTVPDASAIPLGYRHFLLPWHLLEETHINFFNQASFRRVLDPHFSKIEFGRVCACTMNDSPFHVSLVAVCVK